MVQGSSASVQVGVTIGELPATEVTFEFDASFEITEEVGRPGWTVAQESDVIRFSGNRLDADTCVLFDVPLRATEAGTFRVRAIQVLEDGQLAEHPPDGDAFVSDDGTALVVDHQGPPNPLFEQVVYVTTADEASGARTSLLAVTALAGAGVLGYFVLRGRRHPRR